MQTPPISAASLRPDLVVQDPDGKRAQDVEKVSHQFESILLRQFLGDSMKPLLEGGPAGQVYGYLLTDSLASSISDAGGLGFASVLQAQLGSEKK